VKKNNGYISHKDVSRKIFGGRGATESKKRPKNSTIKSLPGRGVSDKNEK